MTPPVGGKDGPVTPPVRGGVTPEVSSVVVIGFPSPPLVPGALETAVVTIEPLAGILIAIGGPELLPESVVEPVTPLL